MEELYVENKIKMKQKDIRCFIDDLKQIITNPKFDIDKNFTFNIKEKSPDKIKFSTPYTMTELEFDTEDVVECLKVIDIGMYSHSVCDRHHTKPPILHIFGIEVNSKVIYTKIKIKSDRESHVICVSFHYPEYELEFPFRKK